MFRDVLQWGRRSFRAILKWDESKHHRRPAGSSEGGQFVRGGGTSAYGTVVPGSATVGRLRERRDLGQSQGFRYSRAMGLRAAHAQREMDAKAQEQQEAERIARERGGGVAGYDTVMNAPQGTGFRNRPLAKNFTQPKTPLPPKVETDSLKNDQPSSIVEKMSGGVNASYRVQMPDGTEALYKPETGEQWDLSFTNSDIRNYITNKDFSLAEREAMASEVSQGLGFGTMVPETHLRETITLPGMTAGGGSSSSGGGPNYDSYDARREYDEYRDNLAQQSSVYDAVADRMGQLYNEAQDEHVSALESRREEIEPMWQELLQDYPEETPYGHQSALRQHLTLPMGSAAGFERRERRLLDELDPIAVFDEAGVDPSAPFSEKEQKEIREVLRKHLDDGYRTLGEVDAAQAKDHLDYDEWVQDHQDTEVNIQDSIVRNQMQSYTEWRHSQGYDSNAGSGGYGNQDSNDDAPHPNGGSLQQFNTNADSYGSPSHESLTKMAVLDYVIGSMDRHNGNVLYENDEVVAIDNGYSMPAADNVDDFTFRSTPVSQWKKDPKSNNLSDDVRQPILDALEQTDWQALVDRHPSMNAEERESFLGRIQRMKDALATENGLYNLWKNLDLMGNY